MSKGNTIVIEEQETPWNKKALSLLASSIANTHESVGKVSVRSEFYSDTGTRSIIVSCDSAQCALSKVSDIHVAMMLFFQSKRIPCTAVIHIKLENLV